MRTRRSGTAYSVCEDMPPVLKAGATVRVYECINPGLGRSWFGGTHLTGSRSNLIYPDDPGLVPSVANPENSCIASSKAS
jgi:hypothetical protein